MAAMSNYLENKLIDQLFRGQAFSFPGTLHFGLLTAAPSDTGGGTEVSGGAYARVSVVASLANFKSTQGDNAASSGTTGTTANSGAITFPAPTANWGIINWMGIYDAVTGGNLLWWGGLVLPKTVNSGDAAPTWAAGDLTCQLDT